MQFNTSVFVFLFLPCSLLLFYLIPFQKGKNVSLLLCSLVFYAWGDITHIVLLIATILLNYFLVLALSRSTGNARRLFLVLAILIDVGVLAVSKYTAFVLTNITNITGIELIVPAIGLPLGVSYFTLKLITYAVDVFRDKAPVQNNVLDLALYAALFCTITAGPITKYESVVDQLNERTYSLGKLISGVRLFCIGISKKVLLSNNIAILAASMLSYGGDNIGVIGAWGGLIAFSFQLYFDFSGYSDMAIGLSRMFGFEIDKNFNYPYISRSVTEFWRRWHVSLSTFFREYIYIPMGGSRVSSLRFVLNMSTVWVLTGIWHGAAWNYIWWGIYYLIVLLLEKFVFSTFIDRVPSLFRHFYVIFVFLIGWCFFWITDTSQLFTYFSALFGAYGLFGEMTYWQVGVWQYYPLLIVCIVASTPIVPLFKNNLVRLASGDELSFCIEGIGIKDVGAQYLCNYDFLTAKAKHKLIVEIILLFCDFILLMLLCVSMVSIVSGSFSPVIYAAF